MIIQIPKDDITRDHITQVSRDNTDLLVQEHVRKSKLWGEKVLQPCPQGSPVYRADLSYLSSWAGHAGVVEQQIYDSFPQR